MATTSSNLVAGKALAGQGGNGNNGRYGLKAKLMAGVAILGCAATLAFGGLQRADRPAPQVQPVAVPGNVALAQTQAATATWSSRPVTCRASPVRQSMCRRPHGPRRRPVPDSSNSSRGRGRPPAPGERHRRPGSAARVPGRGNAGRHPAALLTGDPARADVRTAAVRQGSKPHGPHQRRAGRNLARSATTALQRESRNARRVDMRDGSMRWKAQWRGTLSPKVCH